ncbi:GIY-YIG nuclease family protein [soil metagenome]
MTYFVYILLCSDDSFYTGISNNVEKRFLAHQNGVGASYTKSHKPIKIIYKEECGDRSSALKREVQIKKLTKSQKVELIKNTIRR